MAAEQGKIHVLFHRTDKLWGSQAHFNKLSLVFVLVENVFKARIPSLKASS